jgi:amino acid transporter
VEVALGPLLGFVAGVLLFVTGLTAGAAVVALFAGSVSALLSAPPRWLAGVLVVAVTGFMALVNVRGVRTSARLIEFMTLAKLLPLVGFVVVGAAFVHPANLRLGTLPGLSQVLATSGIVIFAFSGIESALTPSGEIHAPARTVPRASFLALGAATALTWRFSG